jgi:hypothetical protein
MVGATTPYGTDWYKPAGFLDSFKNTIWYYQQLTDIPETEILIWGCIFVSIFLDIV